MNEETNKNEVQEADEQTHDDLLFRFSPASLGILNFATQRAIDFSWLNSMAAAMAAAREVDYSWLSNLTIVPTREAAESFAAAIRAQAEAAMAGFEMLGNLMRAVAAGDEYKGYPGAAVAGLTLQAVANDERPTIEAPDVEM